MLTTAMLLLFADSAGSAQQGARTAACSPPDQPTGLVFNLDGTTLRWDPPSNPGDPPPLLYDTLRFVGGSDLISPGACFETDGDDTMTIDPGLPGNDEVLYYLARAQNGCGHGSAGTDSAGVPRAAAQCGGCAGSADCTNAHGTNSCAGGACAPICDTGWVDCDGNTANGCDINPGSVMTVNIPPFQAGGGCYDGVSCCGPSIPDIPYAVSGNSPASFGAAGSAGGGCPGGCSVTAVFSFSLSVPPGVAYDLCWYDGNFNFVGCAGLGSGSTVSGQCDGLFTAVCYIEVRYVSGCSNLPWTFQIHGTTCPPIN